MPTCLFAHPGAELFGSDRMLLESVVAAREQGWRCVVALPEHGPLVDALRGAGATIVIAPSLVLRKALLRPSGWPALVRSTLRGTASAWRIVARARPDAVYVNTITIPLWPVVARLRGVPSISHVHEAEASGSRLVNALLYAPHLLSRRVLANSAFSLRTIAASLPALARRAVVVANGVAAPADPAPPRARLDGPLRVLYLGRLSPRKGPQVLVAAARLLRERGVAAHVGLLGSAFAGYEWFEDELRASAREAGLGDAVAFHGFHDDVWAFVDACDVLVVPSTIDEPFGNTAVEGILALRPVVASDTSGLREAAGGYPTATLVPPGDATALADALAGIVERWDEVVSGVAASAAQAQRRHAPAAYRATVSEALRAAAQAAAPRGRAGA
ncbi:glycosyltransferase [Agrococcus sediminis]|uniref:glycosyltransferase n=1 Tax=Agrococcus sediminis TaxID=2599924 RepID=UPI003829A98D